jgi:proline racemase
VELHAGGEVTVANVPSHVAHSDVVIQVPGLGEVQGDVAWGGNWFFLTEAPDLPLDLAHASELTDFAWRIRQNVNQQGYPDVDHIELVGPGQKGGNARNFVLCPGKAYDRSPCGTGTSAKLATLAARGQLGENEPWVQESLIGSTFTAFYQRIDAVRIRPFISGRAYVNAESTLLVDEGDPYRWGIHS